MKDTGGTITIDATGDALPGLKSLLAGIDVPSGVAYVLRADSFETADMLRTELAAHSALPLTCVQDTSQATPDHISVAVPEPVSTGRVSASDVHAVKRHEHRLMQLFDQAPAIISILEGPDLRYLYVNPLHDLVTGRAKGTLVGRPLREAMSELNGQDILRKFEQVYQTGQPLEVDELPARLDGDDGAVSYFRQIIQPWFAEDGSIAGVMSFNHNITELVASRESTRLAEKRLRTIQDSLESFVGLLDFGGHLLEVNRLALLRGGLTRADVIGKPFWDCYWWSYDPVMQNQVKHWIADAQSGKIVHTECVVRMADEAFITIDFKLMPSLDDD